MIPSRCHHVHENGTSLLLCLNMKPCPSHPDPEAPSFAMQCVRALRWGFEALGVVTLAETLIRKVLH